jgi:hypothetical protein
MSIKLLRHEFKKRAPLGTGVGSLRLTVAANRQSARCRVEYAGVGELGLFLELCLKTYP